VKDGSHHSFLWGPLLGSCRVFDRADQDVHGAWGVLACVHAASSRSACATTWMRTNANIAMNFLVTQLSGLPPLLFLDPMKLDYGTSSGLSSRGFHDFSRYYLVVDSYQPPPPPPTRSSSPGSSNPLSSISRSSNPFPSPSLAPPPPPPLLPPPPSSTRPSPNPAPPAPAPHPPPLPSSTLFLIGCRSVCMEDIRIMLGYMSLRNTTECMTTFERDKMVKVVRAPPPQHVRAHGVPARL